MTETQIILMVIGLCVTAIGIVVLQRPIGDVTRGYVDRNFKWNR